MSTVSHIVIIETGVPLVVPQDIHIKPSNSVAMDCSKQDLNKKELFKEKQQVKVLFTCGVSSGVIIQLAILGLLQLLSVLLLEKSNTTFDQEVERSRPYYQHLLCGRWLGCAVSSAAVIYLYYMNIISYHSGFKPDVDDEKNPHEEDTNVRFYYFIFGCGCMVSLQDTYLYECLYIIIRIVVLVIWLE